ncbi:MAG: STAS domain-containing protein [Verrucomicrobia bacterium]|nr:STAS domain-containing protein [Verrucomicrobiota bacterium]MBU1736089.1 STAS domain-containing protein [Verrucomicrobiota bacterium]MBU1855520.1 STAS domain-containing protein [Verrucomicrobiota bacterium]
MQIIIAKKAPAIILSIYGHFNAAATAEFERIFNQHLDAGERHFVLNLAEMTFISSAGLCSILATAKKIKERDGNIVICALQGEALKVFEISGFAALFSFYPTEAAALKQV